MIVLDISIVITAIPKIQQGFNASATELTWVHSAYTLFFGGLLLLGARAGDILGRRRMFKLGLGLFTLASFLIGASHSLMMLVFSRALQGAGAAVLAPSTLALLSTNFSEGPERTRAVAYYGSIGGLASTFGLVIGGILTDLISWRAGFFINIPIGIGLILATSKYVSETELRSGQFDILGAISSTLGVGSLVYGIIHAAEAGWSNSTTVTALVAGVSCLTFLVFNELKVAQPIMPLRLFAHRIRSGAFISRILFMGSMTGFYFFTTQYLQGVLNYRPIEAGLAFLPCTIVNFAAAMMVPRLSRRFGNARVLAGSILIGFIGLIWLGRVSTDSSYILGAIPMMLIGIGQGGVLGPLTGFGIADVKIEDAGAASGLVNVAHQLGGSIGLGVLAVIFSSAGNNTQDAHELLATRISAAISGGAVLLGFGLVVIYFLIVRNSGEKAPLLAVETPIEVVDL